eukprot:696355-Heterocapsa_arctica.AAC.1
MGCGRHGSLGENHPDATTLDKMRSDRGNRSPMGSRSLVGVGLSRGMAGPRSRPFPNGHRGMA